VQKGSTPRRETTKAGTSLDAEYARQLSDEAEAGFDTTTLVRRRAGRPSLSGRSGHSNRVDLRVDDVTHR